MKLVATEKCCSASEPQGGKRSVFSIIQHSWETGVKKGASDKGRSKKGFLVSSALRPRGHSPPELALEIAFHSHLVQPFGHRPQPSIAHRGSIFFFRCARSTKRAEGKKFDWNNKPKAIMRLHSNLLIDKHGIRGKDKLWHDGHVLVTCRTSLSELPSVSYSTSHFTRPPNDAVYCYVKCSSRVIATQTLNIVEANLFSA